MAKYNLVVLLGPTASGKTHLGVQLAKHYSGEIISADSRQVYCGLDIGSGKDLHEYGDTPYHLINIVEPGHEFNVFEFHKYFSDAFYAISQRNRLPMLVGGTGMYLDSIVSEYRFREVPVNSVLRESLHSETMESLVSRLLVINKNLHNSTDLLDRARLIRAIEIAEAEQNGAGKVNNLPDINARILGIHWNRDKLKKRILIRLKERIEQGLIEEVAQLQKDGVSWELLHFYGLEYRFVAAYLQGELNKNDMTQKLYSAICTFAKQQEKWFRKMGRKGVEIMWLDAESEISLLDQALKILAPDFE